jgi:hypothetical protein
MPKIEHHLCTFTVHKGTNSPPEYRKTIEENTGNKESF